MAATSFNSRLNFQSPFLLRHSPLQNAPIHLRFPRENKPSGWQISPNSRAGVVPTGAGGRHRRREVLAAGGKAVFLDEEDVVTILDPPKDLIPLDPASYNAAAYLWKKIGDIPEERRHRLLNLLNPRLISRLWEISGRRYEDSKLVKKSASKLLPTADTSVSMELWTCRSSGDIEKQRQRIAEDTVYLCWFGS